MKYNKYFGTDGIRGRVGRSPITPERMLQLGWSIGKVLVVEPYHKVLIGQDTRISGNTLGAALASGLMSAGVDVSLLGVAATPAISWLTKEFKAVAGIVISASHNHFEDNGIKIFDQQGSKLSDRLQSKIEQYLDQNMEMAENIFLGQMNFIPTAEQKYINFLKKKFMQRIRLGNFKIVLDCANGANYRIAPQIFTELGVNTQIIGDRPNGSNINLNCGSTDLRNLIKKVRSLKADLGIAFDGDGDRVMLVDPKGNIIDGDQILYIIANLYLLKRKQIKGVVGTIMSNLGLEKSLYQLGLKFVRTKVGDRYIWDELIKRNWLLGAEPSGHIICRDLNVTGDGIIAALSILEAMTITGKNLQELLAPMQKYPQSSINIPLKQHTDAKQILENVEFKKTYKFLKQKLNNHGRIVVRGSGTEPLIRIMVEGLDQKLITMVAQELQQVILNVI